MQTTSDSTSYLLLFRGTDWHRGLSADEIQSTMVDWMAWFERLVAEGRCAGGQSLADEGAVVSGRAATVSDGPFAESKEAVAGYFLLTVPSFDDAIAIARECPTLRFGMTAEVRPLLARCAASQRVLDQMATPVSQPTPTHEPIH